MNEKITAIVQARMGSTRLPNKVLLPLKGKPILWHIINRLKRCKNIDKIVIATSNNPLDDKIEEFAIKENVLYFRGSEEDLLSRMYQACIKHNIKTFVRVTGDCPFVDPQLIDEMVEFYYQNKDQCDLLSNVHPATFPDGLDLEIIPLNALEEIYFEVKDKFYRECFTTYLFTKSKYKIMNYKNNSDQSKMRWTLDTPEDYEFFEKVYEALYLKEEETFLKKDIEKFLSNNPEIELINNNYSRNYSDKERLEEKNKEEKNKEEQDDKNKGLLGKRKRILIVGCGNIGYRHLRNINLFFKGRIIVCDNCQETTNKIKVEFPNVMVYQDLEEALVKELPTHTIIATPNHLHIPFALKALNHTKNIFIEKPLSHTLEGVQELLEKAEAKNVKVVAGFNLRFHPFVKELKEIINSKELGGIYSIKVNFGSYLPDRHPGQNYREDYVTKESLGGGAILDVIHEIDYLSWIFGLPKEIFAFAEKRSALEMETEDSADILLRLSENCTINFHLDFLRRPYTRIVEVIGEKGTLIVDFAKEGDLKKGELKRFYPENKQWKGKNHINQPDQIYISELQQFINLNAEDDPVSCTGKFAKKVLEVALNVKESAKSGKMIKMEENEINNNIKNDNQNNLSIVKSQKLFKQAQQLIPGQSQTLSKSSSQFVQGISPIFLQSGEGSHVFDVDGNKFIDFVLALGPITLGYNYPKTNQAIIEQLGKGTVFSLPHPLEIEVAEIITKIIPCAEMVRFSKNGTDVTSAAVKIARAYTKREKIAYCGYHGGSADWFGITTLLNKGIPKIMENLILKFEYNKIKSLEQLFIENPGEIAAVIMEPIVYEKPKDKFLENVKEIAKQNGAVLIFDEMVTGFRVSLGGAQQYYNVIPDLATFGKGVANGMPLSILVGRKEIMQECESVFFSMTFGGETLSLATAKATIEEMQDKRVIEHFWKQGGKLKEAYNQLAHKYELENHTKCTGLPVHNQFEFINDNGLAWYELKSLFLQETVKRGILFSGVNNVCLSHSNEDIEKTTRVIEETFIILKKAITENKVTELLEGKSIQPIFKRSD